MPSIGTATRSRLPAGTTSLFSLKVSRAVSTSRGNMRILSFLLLLITGLAMALPGLYLASLGGSLYYVVAGLLILVAGFLILRRKVWGICLYWSVLLATFAWSLWEVGFDGWALMPRLVFLSVGALWLLWLAPTDRPVSSRLRLLTS